MTSSFDVILNLASFPSKFLNSIFILSMSDAYTVTSGNYSSTNTSKDIVLISISSKDIASSENSTVLFGIGILF